MNGVIAHALAVLRWTETHEQPPRKPKPVVTQAVLQLNKTFQLAMKPTLQRKHSVSPPIQTDAQMFDLSARRDGLKTVHRQKPPRNSWSYKPQRNDNHLRRCQKAVFRKTGPVMLPRTKSRHFIVAHMNKQNQFRRWRARRSSRSPLPSASLRLFQTNGVGCLYHDHLDDANPFTFYPPHAVEIISVNSSATLNDNGTIDPLDAFKKAQQLQRRRHVCLGQCKALREGGVYRVHF